MSTFIALALLAGVVLLVLCAVFSWLRYREERGRGFLVGAIFATIFALIGVWYVFFAGVFQ